MFSAGVLYSTAGLFTQALSIDIWTILTWRAVFGTLFMLVWMAFEKRGGFWRSFRLGPRDLVLTVLTAFGSFFYIFALKLSTVADVMVIYATLPFVTMIVAWLWTRAKPDRRMLAAGAVAMVGVAVMMVGGAGGGTSRLSGIGLTFLMNVSFAIILVSSRESPRSSSAIFTLGLAFSGVIAAALASTLHIGLRDLALCAGFGTVTIGLAMALYMVGARLIPPAEVGLLGIVDVVIGPALVWLVFAEVPGLSACAGGVIIVAALIWHLWPDLKRTTAVPRAEPGL